MPPPVAPFCLPAGFAGMAHPGLPMFWVLVVLIGMGLMVAWLLFVPQKTPKQPWNFNLSRIPVVGAWVNKLTATHSYLLFLKIIFVIIFLWVIAAGLFGNPIPERNLATVMTWTVWWTLVIISVFFLGSAWCAVCPWDSLAGWLVKQRLWKRGDVDASLNRKPPRWLRTLWPACIMFMGLTWLELGVGVTINPVATASMALLMVVLATASIAIFERKAFCRYICPIGRTIGCYSQLAPVELRPVDSEICAKCETLECYHGTEEIEPCPTHLVMGRFSENTYCTSCGACVLSCPDKNISWRLRSMAVEARSNARPHWDEAWFMLSLLAMTSFHGVTMMPFWENLITGLARLINDSANLLGSFTIGIIAALVVPSSLYAIAIWTTEKISPQNIGFRRLFSNLSFTVLPVAFAYHLAHNLSHLAREGGGFWAVVLNPFGEGALPFSSAEKHIRTTNLLISEGVLYALQAGLLLWGFWLAVVILRSRGGGLSKVGLLPVGIFIAGMTGFNLWLLAQDMIMRF
jgi:polyferredoxin